MTAQKRLYLLAGRSFVRPFPSTRLGRFAATRRRRGSRLRASAVICRSARFSCDVVQVERTCRTSAAVMFVDNNRLGAGLRSRHLRTLSAPVSGLAPIGLRVTFTSPRFGRYATHCNRQREEAKKGDAAPVQALAMLPVPANRFSLIQS